MNRRKILKNVMSAIPALCMSGTLKAAELLSRTRVLEKLASGPFSPSWKSLEQYQTPEWFSNAKFGIWAHWGPQCQPEFGDWYAREMYDEGSRQYNHHLQKYGHPSKSGFKEVINDWKAEKWNPERLMALYKRAGAQYFVALANHHDNLDLYDSKYQQWNSVKVGPKKDLIGGWAKAAKKQGLRFGVSVHAAHAWTWMEPSQRADKKGPLQGVPYDGKLRKEDGAGTWWEGLDPQELYAQNHPLSQESENIHAIHKYWNWQEGVSKPDQEYCDKFFNRTVDLINKYEPDLVYFDDTALPLWPVSDVGLKLAAHMYNSSIQKNGKLEAVINGKILDEQQRKTMVWDIERGQSNQIEPLPWQTCTCIGNWHYDRDVFEKHRYKSAKTVIHTLADVVSKNGNLLLSVPVKGDGSLDSDELKVLADIGTWMKLNGESIFSTRPWKVFGEGPAQEAAAPITAQGFNEGKGKPFGPEDIRFTSKGATVYAIVLGWPANGKLLIKTFAEGSALRPEPVKNVRLCGGGALKFARTAEGLEVSLPVQRPATDFAFALKIS